MTRLLRTSSALCLLSAACASDSDSSTQPLPETAATTTADSKPASTSDADEVNAHIQVVLQRIAASNAQDWDTWQALHTDNAVRTAPGLPGPVEGAPAMRAAIEELFVTFPNYHLELVDAFGSGDMLVARIHTRATMSGPLQLGENSVPATGQSFEQDWLAWLRFEGDRIAAIDEFYDNYEILVQLGLSQ